MIVSKDGLHDFTSIQEAIDSISASNQEEITIYIKKGVYKEKLFIEKPFIKLIGEGAEETIITYDDYALKCFPNGETYGTFNSYTAFIGGHDFTAEHLTFENSSGPGSKVGQAVAAYVDADRVCFRNCRFLGNQDTIFTGPLPPAPIIAGSFKGPREHAIRENGRQYYENCYIQGDIDFIFGSATAFFYNCEIFSNDIGREVNGYIVAPSTPEGQEYGYVFENCRLTSNCPAGSVYLGRPWRIFAQTAFIRCELGAHIAPSGWHNWNKFEAEDTTDFIECDNYGDGACTDQRADWTHRISASFATYYSREKVLGGLDGWRPFI